MNHVRDMFCTIINDEVEACSFYHYRNIYYKAVDKTHALQRSFRLLSAVRCHTAAACEKLCLL